MKFSQKKLRIGDFEKRPFWKNSHFFSKEKENAWSPWKSVSNYLCDRMDGTQFWCFRWFPANSLLCIICIIQCWVYLVVYYSIIYPKARNPVYCLFCLKKSALSRNADWKNKTWYIFYTKFLNLEMLIWSCLIPICHLSLWPFGEFFIWRLFWCKNQ